MQSGSERAWGKLRWTHLLRRKQTCAIGAGTFMIDASWWFYLFWIPDFLQREHGLHLTQIGPPIVVIYVISDLGSIAGGWLSSSLLRRGSFAYRRGVLG